MTIASQTSRIAYTGDGGTTAFAVPFYFAANTDIVVYLQDTLGNQTLQILGTNYNLTGPTLSAGGTCTFIAAPTTGYLVTIYRDPPATQTTSYNNNDPFAAKSHEMALDKLTTLAQRTRDLVNRSVHLSEGEATTTTTLAPIADRKNKLIGFGTNGELVYPLGPTYAAGTFVGVADVDSRATASVTTFPASISIVQTAGYSTAGTGGARYKRVASMPSHVASFRSADRFLPSGAVDAANGGWWEVSEAVIDIRMAGAIGDGNTANASVNANAVRAALTLCGCAMIPATAAGFHFGAEEITVGNGQWVRGLNGTALVKSSGARLFKMTGNDDINNEWNGVTDLTIDMADASAGSMAIGFATSQTVCSRNLLSRLTFKNCFKAIGADAGGTYTYYQIFKDIKCNSARGGPQFHVPKSRGFIYVDTVDVDNTLAGTPIVTWASVLFEDYIGVYLKDLTVTGQNITTFSPAPGYQSGAIGIKFIGTIGAGYRHIWANRVRVEASAGPGIQVINTTFFQGDDVEAFACMGLAVYFETVDLVQIGSLAARGANDFAGAPSATHGVSLVGVTKCIISNIRSGQNTGSGVLVNNSSNVQLPNIYTEQNSSFGLLENGTSNANTFGTLHSSSDGGSYFLTGIDSKLGTVVANGTRQSSPQHFSVNKGATDQAVSVFGSYQKVTFTSAAADPRSLFDLTNIRANLPRGTWRLLAKVAITAGVVAGVDYDLAIYKNGVAIEIARYRPAYANAFTMLLDAQVDADGGFYEVYVFGASGSGSYTIGGGTIDTSFSGYMA